MEKVMDAGWANVTYDLCLETKPTKLYQVILTDDGVGPADVTIYDGHNTGGKVVSIVRTLQNTTLQINLEGGITLQQGLFIDVGTNVGSCLLRYKAVYHDLCYRYKYSKNNLSKKFTNPSGYFAGDDSKISFKENYLLNEAPFELDIWTWNDDTLWDHRVFIRIGLLRIYLGQKLTSFKDLVDLV